MAPGTNLRLRLTQIFSLLLFVSRRGLRWAERDGSGIEPITLSLTTGELRAAPAGAAPILSLDKLDKRFSATHALKAVDLAFEAGEIHAIVGENGAGKSTLIKLLTGVHPRSSREVYWRDSPVPLASPHEAIGLGINAVHQEVVLCPHLTLAHNIFLGDEPTTYGLLNERAILNQAEQLLDDLGSVFRPAPSYRR